MPQTTIDLSQSDRRVTPALTHDIILGDLSRPVASPCWRCERTSSQDVDRRVYTRVSRQGNRVSAEVSTWRATNLVIPSTGKWSSC